MALVEPFRLATGWPIQKKTIMLPDQRHIFDIPADIAYYNCAQMSPLMNAVRAAGHEGVDIKGQPWRIAIPDFFTLSESTRGKFARLVHAEADDIAIIPSVSYGLATAAANLAIRPGEHILCLEEQFPSNVYIWRRLARENGGEVRMIPRAAARHYGHTDWTPAILDAMDDKTAIVALPHCQWTDGALIDIETIGRQTRRLGAALVVDITQSGGALPFDVQAVRPDFMVCATYKWLLGPYSLGFLYAAPACQNGRALEENWISREDSEDFARLVDYKDGYQPGARRYDMGERSNFHLMPMASAALEQILAWGVGNIAATLAAKTASLARRAESLGLESAPPELRAGHYLGLRPKGGFPPGLLQKLAADGVFVSIRGSAMRVTPHLYNTAEDEDRLMASLAAHLGAGA